MGHARTLQGAPPAPSVSGKVLTSGAVLQVVGMASRPWPLLALLTLTVACSSAGPVESPGGDTESGLGGAGGAPDEKPRVDAGRGGRAPADAAETADTSSNDDAMVIDVAPLPDAVVIDVASVPDDAAVSQPGDAAPAGTDASPDLAGGGNSGNACPGYKKGTHTQSGVSVADFCAAYAKRCAFDKAPMFADAADCQATYQASADPVRVCRAGHLCEAIFAKSTADRYSPNCQASAHGTVCH